VFETESLQALGLMDNVVTAVLYKWAMNLDQTFSASL
jgi:hypothetical protein